MTWIKTSDEIPDRHVAVLAYFRDKCYVAYCEDGEWYMAGREIELAVEGQGKASFRYLNRYNDSIKVDCYREGGVWYFGDADIKMEKKPPEKPKD